MPAIKGNRLIVKSMLISACAMASVAIFAQAQYNSFDSDSNSELGKLVRGSGRGQSANNYRFNQQQAAALAAATRNLQNQPLQFAPANSNRRNYGLQNAAATFGAQSGFGPTLESSHGLPSSRSGSKHNSEMNDEDEGSNYGSGFNSNFDSSNANNDEGEGNSGGESPVLNLKQAASRYTNAQHDFNGEGAGATGFNFDGANYGPSGDEGSEFGPANGFGLDGRREKQASSISSKNSFGSTEEDAGAPQYGPNSAINADGEEVVEEKSNYSPQQDNNEGEGDDE